MESRFEQPISATRSPGNLLRGMVAFRRFVSFLLIIALVALVAILLLKNNLNEQVRRIVEKKIGQVFSKAEITVQLESAIFDPGQGFEFGGLTVSEKKQLVIAIDQFTVKSDADIWDLISGKIEPGLIQIDGLQLNICKGPDGVINLVRIFDSLEQNGKMTRIPRILFRNCRVNYQPEADQSPIEVKAVAGELNTNPVLRTASFRTKLTGQFFRSIQASGHFSFSDQSWTITGCTKKMSIDRGVFQHLPPSYQTELLGLKALRGKLDFDFEVVGDASHHIGSLSTAPEFVVTGSVSEARIEDKRLPFPISDLNADFTARNSGVKIENVVAESDLGKIRIDCLANAEDNSFELVAKIDPLYLDRRTIQKLPEQAKSFLQKYDPQGAVRLTSRLQYQSGQWIPDVRIDLLGISFAFHKCPYPVENSTGFVTLIKDKIGIDIRAQASGRTVSMKGSFWNPGPDAIGTMVIDVDGQIPFDEKVFSALKKLPDVSNTVAKFHPRGKFGFGGQFSRKKGSDGRVKEHFQYTIKIHDTEVNYDLFPLPFHDVDGTILINDGAARFVDFRGKNVLADSYALGSWSREKGLDMTIEAFDVEINNSLKSAMPKPARQFLDTLKPNGSLQTVRARVKVPPQQELDYVLEVTTDNRQSTLSVTPSWLPYEMKSIELNMEFRPDSFLIKKFKGFHRDSELTMRGDGTFDVRGWTCNLRDIYFGKMVVDRELTSALPTALGQTVESLDVDGLFNMYGSIAFKSQAEGQPLYSAESAPIQTVFDLTADVDKGSLSCGILLEDVYGAIRLTGKTIGDQFQSVGGIDLDSLHWNDLQFKRIKSPIYIDNSQALLGVWATSKMAKTGPEPLVCNTFGGRLAGNASFSFSGKQKFEIQATFADVDLNEFTFDLAPNYSDIVGRGKGGLRLTGDNSGYHSLRGEGEVRLEDAKISEVPVILGMLKLLSVKQIDRTLFNESRINMKLRGEHVFFDRLEFLGDAISLRGNGEMNFDRELALQFYTTVGRGEIPVVSPLLGAASQQILVIDVTGTTEKPVIKKNFFKILNDKLKSNIEDLEQSLEEGGDAVLGAAEFPLGRIFK
jgi:hypothetical protein